MLKYLFILVNDFKEIMCGLFEATISAMNREHFDRSGLNWTEIRTLLFLTVNLEPCDSL
jgi:hypothetical protein